MLLFCCYFQYSFSQNFIDKYLTDPLVYTTIANSSNSINKPRDLDFKPNTNEMWVVNYGTTNGGNVVIIYNASQPDQSSQYRKDSHTGHFMMYPSALAFSDNGEWGSSSEIKNTSNSGSTFMGPALWSGDTSITARVFQNNWVNGYPLGSHLDMLHQSPFAMGIAADSLKVFWVFDGWNGNICRYDFNIDHSPGYDNHSAGKIWRYSDIAVTRTVGVPSHMVLDRNSKWLYFIDGGSKTVKRMNTLTGTIVGNLTAPNEQLTLYKNVTGATQQTIDTYTSQPCGMDYFNDRLIVSDYVTGEIKIYNTAVATPTLMGTIATAQTGIMGVRIGTDGKIWFVNNTQNTVVRIDPLPATNDASILEIVSPLVENTEPKFFSPAFNVCANSVAAQIALKNAGSNNLTSVNINYSIDNVAVSTFSWTGSLAAGVTATVTLPSASIGQGTHKIRVYTSNPNGSPDLNPLNDCKEGSFRSLSPVMPLPFTEDFTGATFPPTGWSYIGYNKFCYMSRSPSVGGFGLSSGALKMDNFSGADNITGQIDYFLSPRVNFSSAFEITFLTFDVAYAQRNGASTDNLEVSVSTDCGNTWTSVYNKAGSTLATGATIGSAYMPAAEEWRTDSVDLAAYNNQPEVMLLFRTNSNWGNNLYIDNINITSYSTVGIHKNELLADVKVYPNPSSGKIKIDGLNKTGGATEIKVMNMIGQEIITTSTSENEVLIDLTNYDNGAYFISISNGAEHLVKKAIISKN